MSLIPNTNAKYVGIEIECIIERHESVVKEVLKKYKLDKCIEVDYDGSVETEHADSIMRTCPECNGTGQWTDTDTDETYNCYECNGDGCFLAEPGYELKVLVKQTELKGTLMLLSQALTELEAWVNESCGLHVHLDMRNRNFESCTKKLLNVQGIMFDSVPQCRKSNSYCRPINTTGRINLGKISKYHAIHTEDAMDKYKTIEVRLHEGTVDCMAIFRWVRFLLLTIDTDVAVRKIRTIAKYPLHTRKYLERRIESYHV